MLRKVNLSSAARMSACHERGAEKLLLRSGIGLLIIVAVLWKEVDPHATMLCRNHVNGI